MPRDHFVMIRKTGFVATSLFCSWLGIHDASAQNNIPGAVIAASGGRFVFGQMSGSGADQYMLDTQTGHLWKLLSPNGSLALVPVPYQDPSTARVAPPPDESGMNEQKLAIDIAADGGISLLGEQMDLPGLAATLNKLGARQPKPVMLIRAGKTADYKRITDVLDACRAAGLDKVSFVTLGAK